MNCPRCNHPGLPPDATYCPYCGVQIQEDDNWNPTPIPFDSDDPPTVLVSHPPAAIPTNTRPPAVSSTNARPPAAIPTSTRPVTRRSRNTRLRRFIPLLFILVVLLIAGTIYGILSLSSPPNPSVPLPNGIGVTKAHDGEYIGISDGTYAFDISQPGGIYKREAADKLKAHDTAGAESFWQQAIVQDTNDAETLIYLEDQHVLASGNPYITIVVGTILSGSNISVGRYNLQGAYVAQKEYNDSSKLPNGIQVRLLIANSGSQAGDATAVAKQIVQVANTDRTFVGVIGWPLSDPTLNVIKVLNTAHIPMISSAASDTLSGISPYFFRVVASARVQASVAVKYVEQTLYATRAVVFTDPNNSYSSSVASDFSQQFKADGNTIAATEQYTVGKPATLIAPLQKALNSSPPPNLIYFAGYASDASTLLSNMPTSGPLANLPVVGPNALYELGGYQGTVHAAISHLRLTTQAYPDEWDVLGYSAQKPKFFADYAYAFDPNKLHQGSPYGYTRPDADAMLSYDAMLALLSASNIVLANGKQSLTPSQLQKALTEIKGTQAIQGVSGQISFAPNGEVTNKEVLILCVAKDITFHLIEADGQFLVRGPTQVIKKPLSSCS